MSLIDQFQRIPTRKATKEEVLTIYDEKTYDKLKYAELTTDKETNENINSKLNSFEKFMLNVGCTKDLIDNIVSKKVQDGIAIICPPFDHATELEFKWYRFLDNIAISTHYSLNILNLKRILIIDWDVHSQATQQFFYDNPQVLYFSIHRSEYGELHTVRESDYDGIGEGDGEGFNFNISLKTKSIQKEDYLSIFQQILIPVAFEVRKCTLQNLYMFHLSY